MRHDRHLQLALFIGVVAVAVRFVGIDQPFIDRWSWRQSDVAAIARNYFVGGYHFAYPQIDWAGDQPGYVGTEFPILPFVVAIIYKIFGVHEWIGRTESLLFFAVSLPFFFLLVRETFGSPAALWALIFYSFAPLNLMTSRCFMPDTPSLSLSIVAICLFDAWLRKPGLAVFLVGAACMAFSILIKVPSLLNGVPIFYLAWRSFGPRMFRQGTLWLYGSICLVPSAIWYGHAYRVSRQFYPHHFFGAGGFQIESGSWYGHIASQTISGGLTPVLVGIFLVGIAAAIKVKRGALFGCWLGTMIVFVFVAGYGNRHPWYQLPFVPIAAAFAGFAVHQTLGALQPEKARVPSLIFRGVAAALLVAFAVMSWLAVQKSCQPAAADLRAAGLELRQESAPDALIIAADYGDPTLFYYAERKGWHFTERDGMYNGHPLSSSDAIADLDGLRSRGANLIVFYSGTLWWLDYYRGFADHLEAMSTSKKETPEFRIYHLGPVGTQ